MAGGREPKQLPAGWSSGQLDDGRTYYFNVAKPGAVSFDFPHEPESAKQQQHRAAAQAPDELSRCIALHTWDRQAGANPQTDLLFVAGDSVVIVSQQPGQGWLTGRVMGDTSERTGIFPANFVSPAVGEGGAGAPRVRTPDPDDDTGETNRPRSPDPDSATGTAVSQRIVSDTDSTTLDVKANWNAAAPAELVKQKGAYVYDEVTGQWKLNAELEAKKKERQEEHTFYRSLFQQCANEVAHLRRSYDKGIKARFRSMARLSQAMGEDSSQWTKKTVADARWASVEAAAGASGVRKRGPRERGAGVGGLDYARPIRRRQSNDLEAEIEELQLGDMVELHAITNEARQHLNGCRGEVMEAKGEDGRCRVRISMPDGSQVGKRLLVSQIRRVAPLMVGDTAEVFGLPSNDLLNGAHGAVKDYDPKQRLFVVAMAGARDADGLAETVLRRFPSTNLRRVSSLQVGDEVQVHGLTGTSHVLNGCSMYIHRWDSVESQFVCAQITAGELQARRDARKQQMQSRREGRKVLIHHDPITGTTSYDTTGDGQPDAYDTTGDMQIDTFMEVPLDAETEAQEKRHFLHPRNLRKKAQWEQGDRVVIHGLQSLEGQRLNGMHGTIVAYASGRYIVDVSSTDGVPQKLSPQNLRRVGALQPGDTAEVHGLTGDPEKVALNGFKAVVKEYLPEHALFVVSILLPADDNDEDGDNHSHSRSKSPEEFRLPAVNLRPTVRENLERRLKVIFDTLDVDNSGSLSRDELAQMNESLDVELRDMLSAVIAAAREKNGDQHGGKTGSDNRDEVPTDIFRYLDVSKSRADGTSRIYDPNGECDLEEFDSQGDGVVTWEEFRALLGPDEEATPEPKPEPEPEPEPEPKPVLVAAAVAMLGDDRSSWEAYTTIAGALTRVKMERAKLLDELELEVGRKREKLVQELAKQETALQQKMQAFKKTQDLELVAFDQMYADGQSSTGSSDAASDVSNTVDQLRDIAAERDAFIAEQQQAYKMKELSLRQQAQKKLDKQEKACAKGIATARAVKFERIEHSARGVLIKPGVYQESLHLDAGSLVVQGEEGADTVICPVDTEPAVQVAATKPKPLRVGSQVKVLSTNRGAAAGPERAVIKGIIAQPAGSLQHSLKYKIAYDASYRATYFSGRDPGLVVVDADQVVPSRGSGSDVLATGGLSIAATTVAAGDRLTVVATKPVAMWAHSEYGLSLEASKVKDISIGTVIEVLEVKEWTEHDQRDDAHRIAEKRNAERLEAEQEEARLLEQYDGDVAAMRKSMVKNKKSKDKQSGKKELKPRKQVELGTWVRCRVVEMAPLMGVGPFEDTDVDFVVPTESQVSGGWVLAVNKTPPKMQASLLPWNIPSADTWVEGGMKRYGLSTAPSDLRQAAMDAESKRHALSADLEMPNSGTAVALQHLTLLSSSSVGSVIVHNGAKLTVSHGCAVGNSSSQSGHGVVAHPGSQITMENAAVVHCTGVGLLIHGGVTAKLVAVDVGHCDKGGVSAAKGSTLSLDKCRIHQCSGGPGIRAEAPSAGGLVVRNCEIACIQGEAGIEIVNAVKKSTLKSVASAVMVSARSQQASHTHAERGAPSSAGHDKGAARVHRPEPPRAAPVSAAEAAAEAWLREAGVSWRRPPAPADNSENELTEEDTATYSEEDTEPQLGMYPGALRVHPYLQKRPKQEESAGKRAVQNLTNAMAFVAGLRADARLAAGEEGGGTGSGSLSLETKTKQSATKQKKLTKSQQRQKEQEEAEQRSAEEQAARERKLRTEWPIVCQTVIWGCGSCGISVVGEFDGTLRDNVIELNAAEAVRLSRMAGGTVRDNRLQSNGLEGLVRTSDQLSSEAGDTMLENNYGHNWCTGALVNAKVQQRLDALPPVGAWRPDAVEWRPSSGSELGRRIPRALGDETRGQASAQGW